jgi:hypothetical protein
MRAPVTTSNPNIAPTVRLSLLNTLHLLARTDGRTSSEPVAPPG